MPKLKNLPQNVDVTKGFPGKYTWKGGTSYYLNGAPDSGDVHFSLKGGNEDELADFHITPEVLTGTNIGIWYKPGGDYSNTNKNNLPSHKEAAWETWWAANKEKCDEAAKDFWTQLTK